MKNVSNTNEIFTDARPTKHEAASRTQTGGDSNTTTVDDNLDQSMEQDHGKKLHKH